MTALDIVNAVCDAYGKVYVGCVTPEQVLSNSRRREAATCRQISAYILRVYGGLTYEACGRALGNKDHSTMLHAVKSVGGWKVAKALEGKVLSDAVKSLGNPARIEIDGASDLDMTGHASTIAAMRRYRTMYKKAVAERDAQAAEVARLNSIIQRALSQRPTKELNRMALRPLKEVVMPTQWTPEQLAALRELRKTHKI